MLFEARHPDFHRVVGADAAVEQVASGFGFTEGPVWDRAGSRLVFSDMKDDHMRCWSERGGVATGVATYRRPSRKANGNTFDRAGRLLSCEHATSRVVREERNGAMTVLASHYQGVELNSPNDIVVKSDGAVYFTDPTYGRVREDVGVLRDLKLQFRGCYRIAPDGGDPQMLASDFEQPNGLCFSLDEKILFINDTARRHIRAFDVRSDGMLAGGSVWATATGAGTGSTDGMKVDSEGRLYCTGPGGIHVFDRDARCLGVILIPEKATNCAWGDDDARSLYVTAGISLYRVRLRVPGRFAG